MAPCQLLLKVVRAVVSGGSGYGMAGGLKTKTLPLFYKGIMLPQTLCPQHSDAHMLLLVAGMEG